MSRETLENASKVVNWLAGGRGTRYILGSIFTLVGSRMDPLSEHLSSVKERINAACARADRDPAEVKIVAVTKGHPAEIARKACALGLRHLAENRVQEALEKYDNDSYLTDPRRPQLHLIGHLQSNKVRRTVRLFDSIDSVDSLELASLLDHEAEPLGKQLRVLIQVNTTGEAQKSGVHPSAAVHLVRDVKYYKNIDVRGFMTIGPLDGDEQAVRRSFQMLRQIRDKATDELGMPQLTELSMGMSDDFEWAIAEGATEIRLGTVLWGPRAV